MKKLLFFTVLSIAFFACTNSTSSNVREFHGDEATLRVLSQGLNFMSNAYSEFCNIRQTYVFTNMTLLRIPPFYATKYEWIFGCDTYKAYLKITTFSGERAKREFENFETRLLQQLFRQN